MKNVLVGFGDNLISVLDTESQRRGCSRNALINEVLSAYFEVGYKHPLPGRRKSYPERKHKQPSPTAFDLVEAMIANWKKEADAQPP